MIESLKSLLLRSFRHRFNLESINFCPESSLPTVLAFGGSPAHHAYLMKIKSLKIASAAMIISVSSALPIALKAESKSGPLGIELMQASQNVSVSAHSFHSSHSSHRSHSSHSSHYSSRF